MKNPFPVQLKTSEEVRKEGWAAEARDADNHLMSTHAPFRSDGELLRYMLEGKREGWTVTVWPISKGLAG